MPKIKFNTVKHVENLISDKYYFNLVLLRNSIEKACDKYFQELKAPKVDLYLVSNSVSSPMALGSDSIPVEFNMDNNKYFLADSSQFGMEPLVVGFFDMVYCYLPSFRGEDPDERHLNQFYHCEAELRGGYLKAISIAENLVKHITREIVDNVDRGIFEFENRLSFAKLGNIIVNDFPRITFNEAISLLENHKYSKTIKYERFGRILTKEAEHILTKIVTDNKMPVWVTNYDRDTVAFYQKPDANDGSKVLNADLLVPALSKNGFGGEILGLGQRQDKAEEIIESMKRQDIDDHGQYDWYVKLRNNSNYKVTSGFGMGIERYISWILGLDSLVDACIYPVIKGGQTTY